MSACSTKVVNKGGSSDEGAAGALATEGEAGVTGTAGKTDSTGGGASSGQSGSGMMGAVTGTSTASTTATTTAGSDSCGAGLRCLPTAPTGWLGPVIHFSGAEPPSCPSLFPTQEFDAGSSLVTTGTCNCSCLTAPMSDCSGADLFLVDHSGQECVGIETPTILAMNDCRTISGSSASVQVGPPTPTCAPGAVQAAMVSSEFGRRHRACGGVMHSDTCAAGVCVPSAPSPFDAGHCIYREGEHECPASYPEPLLLHSDIIDSLHCPDTCDCEPRGSGECFIEVQFYPDVDCSGPSQTSFSYTSEPACSAEARASLAVPYAARPSGSVHCEAQHPDLRGEVTPVNPITLCCN